MDRTRRTDVLRTHWLEISPAELAALMPRCYRRGPVRFAYLCFIERHTKYRA